MAQSPQWLCGPCRWLRAVSNRKVSHRAGPTHRRAFHRAIVPPNWKSISGTQLVRVKTGSIEGVNVYLHNIKRYFEDDTPLFIYLPPRGTPNVSDPPVPELPRFLQDHPTVTIAYRWHPEIRASCRDRTPLCWPTPTHDVGFAWKWITDSICTGEDDRERAGGGGDGTDGGSMGGDGYERRGRFDVNIIGSYRGAGLAVALALNGSFARPEFGIRKVMAYNGIYNWSMFLPQHRIWRPPAADVPVSLEELARRQELAAAQLADEQSNIKGLFDNNPANLLDPFASPSLFYLHEDINAPHSFDPEEEEDDRDVLRALARRSPAPRRARVIFPPLSSCLEVPQAEFYYTPLAMPLLSRGWGDVADVNCYELQARQITHLMQRSIVRKEIEPWLWKYDEGTAERKVFVDMPKNMIRCEPLTDREYGEISLVYAGA